MDMHKANNMKLRRYLPPTVNVDANGVPIPMVDGQFDAAGVNPGFDQLSHEDYTVTTKLYAKSYIVTDEAADFSEDNLMREATTNLGEWAGMVEELVAYYEMLATPHVYYANGTATSAVNTPVTKALLGKVERSLLAEKALHFERFSTGSTNYKTTPVPATFVVLGHTNLKWDFENISGFKPVEEYGSQKVISKYEVGTAGAFRVILTPNFPAFADAGGAAGSMVSTSGTNADVYKMIAFGKRSACVSWPKAKKGMKILTVPKDTPSPADPAGRNAIMTAKDWFASKITNPAWVSSIEVAATDM
jgi:N4-gp56 family major capsid protein